MFDWNPLRVAMPVGLREGEDVNMVDGPFEDWSRVRSPGRARRRRRKHRQNIRLYYKPKPGFMQTRDGLLIGHPDTFRALRAKMAERMNQRSDDILRNAIYGGR